MLGASCSCARGTAAGGRAWLPGAGGCLDLVPVVAWTWCRWLPGPGAGGCLVPVAACLVRGPWSVVRGPWSVLPGAWSVPGPCRWPCLVPATCYLLPATCYLVAMPGPCCLLPGPCRWPCLAPAGGRAWPLAPAGGRAWPLPVAVVPGARSLDLVAVVPGPGPAAHDPRALAP